ncbi:unnamed protein product [Vitrella brassicaformis CCMP3155]|uniref:Uncharacterized protein n=1 Tax=Vitrella brassicaformis (strain CCMP3155) TaxID=1169540 RepID=A0A0G4H439_VITBC|nr:unnamed protein product [Vitrella brassicaformis CCMP3155]|eukprot:CEM38517.1 unnamed protein product [Vitrella brassicaformis CCMP3155]
MDDIFEAVNDGNLLRVTQLIDKRGKKILDTRDEDSFTKFTPVIEAAEEGKVDIMKVMYERYGPSILQQRDTGGESALHWAAFCKQLAAVNQLLAWDPKLIDARDRTKRTAFHAAADHDAVDVMKAMCAIKGKDLLTETDDNGDTALHVALTMGHLAAAAQLLEWGGPQLLEIKNDEGVTPWDMTAEKPKMRKAIEKYKQ